MPCDTIQTNTVDLSKITNHDLLEKALKADFELVRSDIKNGRHVFTVNVDGRSYAVQIQNGEITSTLPRAKLGAIADLVKQAYSREAVKASAKRFGWTIEKGTDLNNFTIVKN